MALSLNEIAALLGTTKPALARRFGGKDDFLAEVLKRYHSRMNAPLEDAFAGADSVKDVARAYLGTYLSILSTKPVGKATGCLLAAATEASGAQTDKPLAQTAAVLNDRTRAELVAALTRAGAENPGDLAQFLYGQSVALAFLSRKGADAEELSDFVERALLAV